MAKSISFNRQEETNMRELQLANIATLGLSVVMLSACTTTQQFLSSPQGQAILAGVEKTAATAAVSAIDQYTQTGSVSGEQVAKDSLSSVSRQLRGLQATDQAADPAAIQTAVKSGSASKAVTRKVAPAVAKAVSDAVQKGAPPDLANEAAAKGLDKVAAKKKKNT
jgi:hypothetical protein